jgi:putative colanic acid biosynthesis acetyltransferase WcaB
MEILRADWRANRGDGRSLVIVTLFRLAQAAKAQRSELQPLVSPLLILYKLVVEWLLTVDLPVRTRVGPGLTLNHAYAIVVHPDAVLGSNCLLIQGVTIGQKVSTGQHRAPVVGDGVSFGAHASVLGPVHIGDGARIGAGAVVLRDVPAGATAVGVPARIV